jgi:hypothetical protein
VRICRNTKAASAKTLSGLFFYFKIGKVCSDLRLFQQCYWVLCEKKFLPVVILINLKKRKEAHNIRAADGVWLGFSLLISLVLTGFVVAACNVDVTSAKSLKTHNHIFDEASRAAFGHNGKAFVFSQ